MTAFHSHDFISPPLGLRDLSAYQISARPVADHRLSNDDKILLDAIRKSSRLNLVQARYDLELSGPRVASAFARLAARGLISDMSPDSTRRASAWKAQCGSVRSLLTERGWLSAPQVRKVGEAMGVPFPLLVCEYLASAKFIDRLQGVVTFYGPEGLPFESQYVVKKITKPPLSLTELRVIKAVENGYSTPAEIATLFNCSRQWIDMVAAHLIEQGFLARERDSSRVRLSRSPKTLPSENKAEIYYDLEMPQPVQRP